MLGNVAYPEIAKHWKAVVLEARRSAVEREKQCWGLLAQHYGIDLNGPDAWQKMATALARNHVPAFQMQHAIKKHRQRAKKPTELDVGKTAMLYFSIYLGEKAVLYEDEKVWLNVLKAEIKAWTKSGVLGLRAIRGLKKQIKHALAAYVKGEATDFQRQFVEDVLPYIDEELERVAPGRQERLPLKRHLWVPRNSG
jgi:hypothetical protein